MQAQRPLGLGDYVWPIPENGPTEVAPTSQPASTETKSSTLVNLGRMATDSLSQLQVVVGASEGASQWAVDTVQGTAMTAVRVAAGSSLCVMGMGCPTDPIIPEHFTGNVEADVVLQVVPGGSTFKHLIRAKHAVDNNEPYRVGKEMAAPTLDAGVLILSMAAGPAMEAGAAAPVAEGGLVGRGGGGLRLFHGTDVSSARNFLNGTPLDAAKAAAAKIDGPPGFFLATHADDAAYFATRRGSGAILEYSFSDAAVRQLGGLPTSPLGPLGRFGRFAGGEAVVPVGSFEMFNQLRAAGQISVVPFIW
ncbi:MAG: hypothetical protein IPK82_17175 [Polyangiaceae bacterium]|nr:hypothetical protein [Polyangiaceae bacterium]